MKRIISLKLSHFYKSRVFNCFQNFMTSNKATHGSKCPVKLMCRNIFHSNPSLNTHSCIGGTYIQDFCAVWAAGSLLKKIGSDYGTSWFFLVLRGKQNLKNKTYHSVQTKKLHKISFVKISILNIFEFIFLLKIG